MSRTETKGERKTTTTTKHKCFPWALNPLLFLRMRYLKSVKWMRIFKRWFNRFFLCSGMKIEFSLSTGIKLEGISLACVFRSLFKAPKRYLSVGADSV